MRTLFLLFVFVSNLCFAGYHKLESFTGNDDQKFTKALAAATKEPGSTIDFGNRVWVFRKFQDVWSQKDRNYLSLNFVGGGSDAQLQFVDCDGPRLNNFKDGSIVRLQMVSLKSTADKKTTGLYCTTDGSSSRNDFISVRMLDWTVGMVAEGLGGADVCEYYLQNVRFWQCGTGAKWIGSNNLEPHFVGVGVSGCDLGFDMQAGSGLYVTGWKGSYTKVGWKIRGGFFFLIDGGVTEGFGQVYQIGGEGYDGYGMEVNCEIRDLEHRDVKTLFASVNKAGETSIKVMSIPRGSSTVELTNKSGKPAYFYGSKNLKAVKLEGDWKLGQAVGTIEK